MKKFEQLKRLYRSMQAYLDPSDYSDQMISALTADFDRLFELTWKTMKEYMRKELLIREAGTGSPRDIIKLAYHEGLIDDDRSWISVLKDRNDDTHLYLYAQAVLYVSRIHEVYLGLIDRFIRSMESKIPEESLPDDHLPKSFFDDWRKSRLPMGEFIESVRIRHDLKTDMDVLADWENLRNCKCNDSASCGDPQNQGWNACIPD